MRRLGRALAVCALSAAGATGCGSVVSTVFTDVGQAVPELPPACESAIAEFLVAIEPIVRNVDFETATDEEISTLGTAMAPATEAFDTDACPELDAEQSRVAWLAIAARVAPGSAGYVDYTFPSD